MTLTSLQADMGKSVRSAERLRASEQEQLLEQYLALEAVSPRRCQRFLDGLTEEQRRCLTENAHYDGDACLHRMVSPVSWENGLEEESVAVFQESMLGYFNILARRARRHSPPCPHRHAFAELYYIVRGVCADTICGNDLDLVPGDLVILMPDTEHCLSVPGDCLIYQAAIRESTLRNIWEAFLASCPQPPSGGETLGAKGNAYLLFRTGVEPELRELMEQMLEECANPHRFFNAMLQGMLSSLLALLFNEFEPEQERRQNDRDLNQLSHYLKMHISEVTLASAAAHFGFSVPYFSTLVRRKTGRSFSEILREQKMELAAKLLAESDATMREICEKTGYESVSQFSASFKRRFGRTPGEFRAAQGR